MLQRYTFKTWCLGLALFVMTTTFSLGLLTIRDSIQTATRDIVKQQAPILTALGHNVLNTSPDVLAKTQWETAEHLHQTPNIRITILDTHGHVWLDSHFQDLATHEDRPEIKEALSGHVGESLRFSKTSKDELYYVAFPITSGNAVIGVSRMAIPLHNLKDTEYRIYQEKAPYFLVFLLAFLGILTGIYQINKKDMRQVVQALREQNPEKIRHDLPDIRQTEIKEACMQLTEKLATELSQKESALQEKKAILDNLTERVLLVAPNDEIIHLNPAAKILFSVSNDNAMYVSQACRNSLFLDSVKATLKNQVVSNTRILFHSPTGPLYLTVTGVPVLLNKQIHALMLLATPTYTWMPIYTKLIQLWIEQSMNNPASTLWLHTLNEAYGKLCKGTLSNQKLSATAIQDASNRLSINIAHEPPISTGHYTVEISLLLTIFITLQLCYPAPTLTLSTTDTGLTIDCQLWDINTEKSRKLDPSLGKFIEELVVYFQAVIHHTDGGFQILFVER